MISILLQASVRRSETALGCITEDRQLPIILCRPASRLGCSDSRSTGSDLWPGRLVSCLRNSWNKKGDRLLCPRGYAPLPPGPTRPWTEWSVPFFYSTNFGDRTLAADGIHGAGRRYKLCRIDLMPQPFGVNGGANGIANRVVGPAIAKQRPDIGFVDREQAIAQLAVRGQPDAVAVQAERAAHGSDEADASDAVGETIFRGGSARDRDPESLPAGRFRFSSIAIMSSVSSTRSCSHRPWESSGMNSM